MKSKEGDYRWYSVMGEPVYDNQNKIIRWVGAFTDIHNEKGFTRELESQVKQRTSELKLLNEIAQKKRRALSPDGGRSAGLRHLVFKS